MGRHAAQTVEHRPVELPGIDNVKQPVTPHTGAIIVERRRRCRVTGKLFAAMPTNVTQEYKKAEQAFREAREPQDRLRCLREMLRLIPKHKGTEHVQADIKTRIKQLTTELSRPRKGGARSGPAHAVRREGAAQVALLGAPNAGKSQLHSALTGSQSTVGAWPHTTETPIPGMAPYHDIHFQLVDLPPVAVERTQPWLATALQPADGALLVVDIASPDCAGQVGVVLDKMAEKRVTFVPEWPGLPDPRKRRRKKRRSRKQETFEDLFRIRLPALLVANKTDLGNLRGPAGRVKREAGLSVGRGIGRDGGEPGCRCPNSCSGGWAWCVPIPRRPASRPIWDGRLPCGMALRSVSWRRWCTRILRAVCGLRGSGGRRCMTGSR